MRLKILVLALVAALCAVGAGAATAHGPKHPKKVQYAFLGRLTATPGNGGVSITVEGGNKRALRAMLGAPVTQTFAYDSSTEFLKWSKGIPAVVGAGDLAAGDYVWVRIRAPRGTSLADLERQPASLVGDHGPQRFKPTQALYLFRGTLSAVGSSTVTVHVTGGNHRALRLLVGGSSDQSLTFGDDTIFLLWQGKVPTVIDASKLVVGDKIVVRVRAPKNATLAQVGSSAARHIGDREPAATS
jgi:hypothetical protein